MKEGLLKKMKTMSAAQQEEEEKKIDAKLEEDGRMKDLKLTMA